MTRLRLVEMAMYIGSNDVAHATDNYVIDT